VDHLLQLWVHHPTCREARPGDQLGGGAVSRARSTVYGLLAIFGIPVLGLLWLISVTPPLVWGLIIFFVVSALVVSGIVLIFTPEGRAARVELSRKARVRSLQQEVSRLKSEVFATRSTVWEAGSSVHGGSRIHEIPSLERKLAEQERELTKVRQELNAIWQKSDGPPFGGWGGDF